MELKISKKASAISPSPTLAIDSKFKEMKKEGIPVVGFGAGEPDFNTPENIKNAGIEAIKNNITKYTPASGTLELKAAVCQKLKRDTGLEYSTSNIVISNGGQQRYYDQYQRRRRQRRICCRRRRQRHVYVYYPRSRDGVFRVDIDVLDVLRTICFDKCD